MTLEQINQEAAALALDLYQNDLKRKSLKKRLIELRAMHGALEADAKRRADEETKRLAAEKDEDPEDKDPEGGEE